MLEWPEEELTASLETQERESEDFMMIGQLTTSEQALHDEILEQYRGFIALKLHKAVTDVPKGELEEAAFPNNDWVLWYKNCQMFPMFFCDYGTLKSSQTSYQRIAAKRRHLLYWDCLKRIQKGLPPYTRVGIKDDVELFRLSGTFQDQDDMQRRRAEDAAWAKRRKLDVSAEDAENVDITDTTETTS